MRRLVPTASDDGRPSGAGLTDDDLMAAYAYPGAQSWLRANMIGAVDGVATVLGLSDGLSGPVDKRAFGILRALADVVIAGAGTTRTENYAGVKVPERFAPSRAARGQTPVPPIAIVSQHLGLDPAAAVFTDTTVPTIVLTCKAASHDRIAALSEVADVVLCGDGEVELPVVRRELEQRGLTRMLCEGGPSLLHDLLAADVLDELCLTVSPMLVGGGERHVTHGEPLDTPVGLRLAGLLEQQDVLLARYVVERG
jgi:5-amino-6-(5-phosphoribosylamino)uracil reductase